VVDNRVVQRVVFAADGDATTGPLYSETGAAQPSGRTTAHIPAATRLRLATYFNAFPAAYWRRWTKLDSVAVDVLLDRPGRVEVWASDASGHATLRATDTAEHCRFELPIDPRFDNGGYYWLELQAGEDAIDLLRAEWSVSLDGPPRALSIGITTFNRPGYCLDQLARISREPGVLALLDRLYVVDQGTELVSEQDGFAEVAEALGEQLQVIRQPNLGGSGGFSRAMFETLSASRSGYVLLLDDDAISEPEAILRAVAFADAAEARQPLLVGGGMLRLDRRSVLFVQGEQINLDQGRPALLPGLSYNHDFVAAPLRDAPELHRRHDAFYNAWWMCLIPVEVIREVGLGLPYFIKWDDMEFGLRAQRAGYPTVSLPGVAVWHQAWDDKFSWRSWEEYFSERNMWLTMIAHQPIPAGVPARAFSVDLGMILSLQYSSAALRIAARRAAADGFAGLHGELGSRLGIVREQRSSSVDADKRVHASDFPACTGGAFDPGPRAAELELGSRADLFRAGLVALRHLALPVARSALAAPQVELDAHQAIWRQFGRFDSALVRYPDGYVWLRRDWRLTWRLMAGSLISVLRLRLLWRRLHRGHREQLARAAGSDAWRTTFRL
jgi:Predicted glycosyltransferases